MSKEFFKSAGSPLKTLFLLAISCMAFFTFLLSPALLPAMEAYSRYAALHYAGADFLTDVNDRIEMKKTLCSWRRGNNILTATDELLAKIDSIVEHAEVVLDMFPDHLHITIIFLADAPAVTAVFKEKYQTKMNPTFSYSSSDNQIAFYSLSEDTIYISTEDITTKVLAHEIGHAIVDHYFKTRVPHTIHELLAQFTEKHISD
jgi:hypothetical protein